MVVMATFTAICALNEVSCFDVGDDETDVVGSLD